MKTLVWLLIIGVAGFFIYERFIRPGSAEESRVRSLESDFNHAADRFIASVRGAGEPGFAVIADPETAMRGVREVRRHVTETLPSLSEEKAIARARALEGRIIEFCRRHDID